MARAAGPGSRSGPRARARATLCWEQGALASAVRRDRPDVFFAPGYTAPLTTGVPLVVAMHDVSFAAHPEWYRWREGLRRRWLARLAARQARAVITISEFSRGEIVRHLGITRRPRARDSSWRGPRPARSSPAAAREPARALRRVDLQSPPPARAGRRLRASRRRGARTSGSRSSAPTARTRTSTCARWPPAAAPGRIRIRDWVDDDELRSLYERASAFAFLSEYEGFGLTPLEALACRHSPSRARHGRRARGPGDAALYVDRAGRPRWSPTRSSDALRPEHRTIACAARSARRALAIRLAPHRRSDAGRARGGGPLMTRVGHRHRVVQRARATWPARSRA